MSPMSYQTSNHFGIFWFSLDYRSHILQKSNFMKISLKNTKKVDDSHLIYKASDEIHRLQKENHIEQTSNCYNELFISPIVTTDF